jgi:hypothetical protein
MIRPTSSLRIWLALGAVLTACAITLLGAPEVVDAQGLIKGVEQGAREGNRAAGPVGGVLGGAIGGVVGVVSGVAGTITGGQPANTGQPVNNGQTANNNQPANSGPSPAPEAKPGKAAKATKTATAKAAKPVEMLTQQGIPQLTAEQIVASSDANIERIKKELNLTAEQEKSWGAFSSAMHYLGHNGADRLNLRIARAKRDPPDDIVEQMRNEAQFLVDRAQDQRAVADAADPLYASLDDKQKQVFIDEMVRLSHERGLD